MSRRPAGRHDEAGEHADRRRLAGTVRAEQAEDLAVPDREGQVVHRLDRAEALAEALHLDHLAPPRAAEGPGPAL